MRIQLKDSKESQLKTLFSVYLACAASVSVGFSHKFRCFGRAKIGATARKKEGGGGEGERRKGNACSQNPGI